MIRKRSQEGRAYHQTHREYARQHGIGLRGVLSTAERDQIVRDYESGLTMVEVAKKNGCGDRTVFRIVKAAGKSRGRSESRFVKTKGWRELRRLPGINPKSAEGYITKSRIIIIAGSLLTEAGLDADKTVWGKWEVGKNQLRLLLRNSGATKVEVKHK